MKKVFVFGTSPEGFQASILNDVQSQFDQFEYDVQPPPATHYLTQQEVAWKLNLDIRTIRRYSRIGLLKAYRYGHRVFYKHHELFSRFISINL